MGVVYKAWDTCLDRLVAINFLLSHLNQEKTVKQRFVQEAKAASDIIMQKTAGLGEHTRKESSNGTSNLSNIYF